MKGQYYARPSKDRRPGSSITIAVRAESAMRKSFRYVHIIMIYTVLISWNQADKLRQPVIKLRDFLKTRRGNNNTVVNSSHTSSHRTRHPASGHDCLRPCMSNLFRTTSRKLLAADPFTCRCFMVYGPSAMYAVLKTAPTLMI
jgi:hypothetical protein